MPLEIKSRAINILPPIKIEQDEQLAFNPQPEKPKIFKSNIQRSKSKK